MVYKQTSRSEKVRQASRARILRSARKLFSKRGYVLTTMRDIAESADTSIGNLYFYFRNKDELLATLFGHTSEKIWQWIHELTRDQPPGAGRVGIALYATFVRLARTDSDLMTLFMLQDASAAVALEIRKQHEAQWRDLLATNFPQYPADQVELAVSAIMGAARRVVDRILNGELENTPLEAAEFMTRWTLRAAAVSEHEIATVLTTARKAVKAAPQNADQDITASQ